MDNRTSLASVHIFGKIKRFQFVKAFRLAMHVTCMKMKGGQTLAKILQHITCVAEANNPPSRLQLGLCSM